MKTIIRKLATNFNRIPTSAAAVLLLGCELFVLFCGAAIVLGRVPVVNSTAIPDALGSAGVKLLALAGLAAAAVGIVFRESGE